MDKRPQSWCAIFQALLLCLIFAWGTIGAQAAADQPPAESTAAAATAPKLPTADDYVTSGTAKDKAGDHDGAMADYNKAIELDPMYAKAYKGRGVVQDEKKDYDSAIADYTEAIQIDPSYTDAYYDRGVTKQGKKDLDGAIADYTKAIELDPKDPDAFSNRGVAKSGKKDLDGAIADFTKAIELNPGDAHGYYNRGIAKEQKGNLYGAVADYAQATKLDGKFMDAYTRGNNAAMAINRQVAQEQVKASQQDPKFAAVYPDQAPPAGYDFITATYTSGTPDKNSQTQVIQRHRFVDGKFVKTEEIYRITEFGVPGIPIVGVGKEMIWKSRYLVSNMGLELLDLWTGKVKRFNEQAPPPYHMFSVISVSPNGLIVVDFHTTPKDLATATAEANARNNLYLLTEPDGRIGALPKEEIPPWPFKSSRVAFQPEISPDGNRRAMHPLPTEKPAPEDGLWLYDWKTGEKRFLAGDFYDSSKAPGPDPCIVWLDNERFVTFRPDGEVILVQWDGTVTSLGRAADPALVKNDLILERDGAGRIISSLFSLSGDHTTVVDVEAKAVTKAEKWELGHDWEVNLPLSPNAPLELYHAGQLIINTRTSGGIPQVSPDGVNVAIYDADKLQNKDAFQKMYLSVYSLATKTWVDFPGNERPIAWVPAAPDAVK